MNSILLGFLFLLLLIRVSIKSRACVQTRDRKRDISAFADEHEIHNRKYHYYIKIFVRFKHRLSISEAINKI